MYDKRYLSIRLFAFVVVMGCVLTVNAQRTYGLSVAQQTTAEELYQKALDYLRGENGVRIDSLKAHELFLKSAEMGLAQAQYEIASVYYMKGQLSNALEWLSKSANQDYIPAIEQFWGYNSNQGDVNEANKWLRKGAELGYPLFQWFLGYNFHFGEDGFPVNSTQAVFWLEKAANQNQPDAANELGEMYYFADILNKDIQKAIYWLQKASDLGNSSAQYNLSLIYEHGEGVDVDKEMAFKLMKESASSGYAKAQNNLGVKFIYGIGCKKDIWSAQYWFELVLENKKADEETKNMAKDNLRKLIQEKY